MNASNIPFALISIETALEMAETITKTIEQRHKGDALLSVPLSQIASPMEQAEHAIATSQKEQLTEEVNEADRKRDRCFIGWRKQVESFRYMDWQPEVQAAAERIWPIIEKHGTRLYSQGLTVQSTLMNALFDDLKDKELSADLETMGVAHWITTMQQLQVDFDKVMNSLESAGNIPAKAAAKAGLVDKLSVLLTGLDFLAKTQPTSMYAETNRMVDDELEKIVEGAEKH